MKKIILLLITFCLLLSVKAQAQIQDSDYNSTELWGKRYHYNGSDYPNSFLKFVIAVRNPRICGTGDKVVFYTSETNTFNSLEVKTIYQMSDARAKKNITPLSGGLGTILGLKPVSFNWKNEPASTKSTETPQKSFGFLAQEIAEVMPEVVTLSSTGDSLVDYSAVIPVLVQAIKELDATVQQLEIQLDEKADIATINVNNGKKMETSTVLKQNTPNPFNGTTNISFIIPNSAHSAFISVCNLQGTLVKKYNIASRGEGNIMVNTSDLGSEGLYMYSLIIDGQIVSTKRMFAM